MFERTYRYRKFEITIGATQMLYSGKVLRGSRAGYLCHVWLSSSDGSLDLPTLLIMDGGRPFPDEQEALIAGCFAGEAAINAALTQSAARAEEALALA